MLPECHSFSRVSAELFQSFARVFFSIDSGEAVFAPGIPRNKLEGSLDSGGVLATRSVLVSWFFSSFFRFSIVCASFFQRFKERFKRAGPGRLFQSCEPIVG